MANAMLARSQEHIAVAGQDQIPVLATTPGVSTIKFKVNAPVELAGNFEKWHSRLVFKSTDISTGVLDIKIEAGSVHTESSMKERKLKSKDCLDVQDYPLITFTVKRISGPPLVFKQ